MKSEIIDFSYFQLKKPETATFDAVLFHGIIHKYTVSKVKGNDIMLSFQVRVDFVPSKSYFSAKGVNKDSLLLTHEQGHADIAVIQARKLNALLLKEEFQDINF